jgi:RHS repeat-associated protein
MLTRPTVSSGTQTLSWDAEGHVETSTDASGQTTYIYDADGNRLVRRDPTGRTLYLPGQEIRYTTATATTSCTRFYTFAGSTIAARNATALTWLSPDHQGTASIAVDVGTQQATVRRQTPFGAPRGAATTWPNDKGFVGGTNDNTGLTHLGAREYDAGLGGFVSVDPVQDLTDPQQWNAYAYASNSPVTASDATGLCDTDACYGHQLGLDDRDKPASNTSSGDSSGSSKTKCKWDCISKKKAPHAGVPVRAMRTLGYNGSEDFTYADALRWAELSENGYLLVCMHTFNRSDDDCHENDPWTKSGPLTKKEALGLIAIPVIFAGIGVGAECVVVYFLCAIVVGQVGRMVGGGVLAGLGGEGGEAPIPQAQLGTKLEYFFGNATGSSHNIQRSGDMVKQLNRIGIQDNARGREIFANHLRSVFADADSVVAIQDNGRIVREGILWTSGGVVKTETIWDGNRLITGNIYGSNSRYRK